MAHEDLPPPAGLTAASRSLRGLLGVIIAVERRFGHEVTPLALLQQIMSDTRWSWLQPFYRMIVDIDHAAHHEALSPEQEAIMGGFAMELLSGQLAATLEDEGDAASSAFTSMDDADDELPAGNDAVAAIDAAADAALFIRRYRELLQADPEVAIAHAAALQALRRLPPLNADMGRRRQLYRQWMLQSEAQRRR